MTRTSLLRLVRRTLAATLALAFAAPAALADAPRYGLEAELTHDDNATRGLYDGKKSDNILAIEGSVSKGMMLGPRSGATLRAGARYSHYFDIEDISNLDLYGRAAWRYQSGTGFSAPWLEIAARLDWLNHSDSELRDGTVLSIDASAGRYVTDRVRLAAGLGFDKRNGGGTAGLYDLSASRIFATVDYRLGVRSTLYARFTRQTGDHVFSSGSTTGLSPAGIWEDDPALREPLGLAVANAYRVDATTLAYELGFNHPLRPGRALDFALARYGTEVDEGPYQGNKYSATQVRATYLYRFQ
jgi:hypothetical protein